jgi:hypothetical protein
LVIAKSAQDIVISGATCPSILKIKVRDVEEEMTIVSEAQPYSNSESKKQALKSIATNG